MKLSFIWHMHQPDYRDGSGIMQMPWVFLHAIKDYYDMPWMVSRHNGIKATFNITPTLIQQLKLYYVQPQASDRFLALWSVHPSSLAEEDRKWVIKICKSATAKTMLESSARYREHHNQEHFNNNELIDLEILFVLSWCGAYVKENNIIVQQLIAKQKDYTNDEKLTLLNELSIFIAGIFDYYLKLHNDGLITLSTTPLTHPILPLLMDMNNALSANPNTDIPKDFMDLSEDARLHVTKAKDLFFETFGFMPTGFWPAEGAVDTKSIALLKECGVEWIATDEEILFRSLNSSVRENLYTPYMYKGMRIVFRNHYLSDLIGFTYSQMETSLAVSNFMHELEKIEHTDADATVFVILDGENAWEFFSNNGFDFFDSLYKNLQESSWCQSVTMAEVLQLPARELAYLAAGSWIHGNFNTWVGHREKTRAWELIYLTKRDYEHHKNSLSEETREKITEHFLLAESSDWFWWYGDDHYSEFGAEFDELFRFHLIDIYTLINIAPPSDLFIPIIEHKSTQNFWLQPQSDISPIINGKHDSFFEWIGCGIIDESKLFSTMDKERGPIKKILYGQDDLKLYFAFEARMSELCGTYTMEIILEPLGLRKKVNFEIQTSFIGELELYVMCQDLLEMSIDRSKITIDEISIKFELEKDGQIIQILPGFGELKIDLSNDYSRNWFI
ncbi:MAG: glycoside hydrolase family 57 protein [Thiovulaceae bacterium]|nr:glycoside hydrolase family 57 protein [Sulfurimonadaceae bacterium]